MAAMAVPVVPIVQMGVANYVTPAPRAPTVHLVQQTAPSTAPVVHPAPAAAPPPPARAPEPPEEPPAKKQKTEDQLIPEGTFLARNPGPVNVLVQVPDVIEKADWKLNGQTINILLLPTDTITTIKQKIQEETFMPSSKQKLMYEGIFVKDSQSLAYYNMADGSVVQLQLKERGGRKR